MKNEIKIIIVLSIIIALLISFCVWRELDQGAKNRAYQRNIAELETTTTELRSTNTKLGKRLEDIGIEAKRIESDYTELEKKYTESLESIRRLKNVSIQLRKETEGFGEDLAELEKLLSEFLID